MSSIRLIDGTLRGSLSKTPTLTGRMSSAGTLRGALTTPQIIREYTSELDYQVMLNKPHINEHLLRAGDNSLEELGIGVCAFEDISALFQ